jgi:SAM-dependent methyltransferase
MTSALKALLKPFVPEPLLARWRRYRFAREQTHARGRALEDVFNEIYTRGVWTPEGEARGLHSGPGSMPGVTLGYEEFVARHINGDPSVATLVDIGCGDFQVSSRILKRIDRPVRYIGCDIASVVVEENQRHHGAPGRLEFRRLNVEKDALPAGELVTIREVFQHLSNETILAALANLRGTFKRAIITEGVPAKPAAPNLDIVSGYRTRDGLNSGVFLEEPPFNLEILDAYDFQAGPDEILRTRLVKL